MIFKLLNLNSSFGAVFADPTFGDADPVAVGGGTGATVKQTKLQKLKRFGSDNQTIIGNVAGGIFVAGGLSAVGVGVSNIYGELAKAHVATFSPQTSNFHAFFNKHSSVLSVPGSLSYLQDQTFVSLVKDEKFKTLFDALAQDNPAGIGNLLKDYNFHNLLQVEGFKELLGNQASLTTLLNNAGVFTETNIPLINTLMGNSGLRTLFENKEFVDLLQDEKFVAILNPGDLSAFYKGQAALIEGESALIGTINMPQAYIDVLNNETLKPIFQNKEIQNLLNNPEMIELMKNPGFAALYNDPALVNLLTNPNLQAVIMNPEFVALLGNSDVINMLNNPEIMNMVSSPEFLTMIKKTGFFKMIENQTAILAVLNDPAIENYINVANQVGVTPGQIAGAVSLMVGGIALALIGAKLIGTGKSKELEKKLMTLNEDILGLENAVFKALNSTNKALNEKADATDVFGIKENITGLNNEINKINLDLTFVNRDLNFVDRDLQNLQAFANLSLKKNVFEKLNYRIQQGFYAIKIDDPKQNVINLTSEIVDEIYNKLGLNVQTKKMADGAEVYITEQEILEQKTYLVNRISYSISTFLGVHDVDELSQFITDELNEALGRTEEPKPEIPGVGDAPKIPATTARTYPGTKFTAEEIKQVIKVPTTPTPGGNS